MLLTQQPFHTLFIALLQLLSSSSSSLLVSSNSGVAVASDDASRLEDSTINQLLPVAAGRLPVLDNHVEKQLVPPSTLQPAQVVPGPVKVRQCEPIRIDLCAGLGYNFTGFPNLAGHDSASDAEQQLRTFGPLIKYECSSNGELKLFLCAVYVPMCTEQFPDVIGPCRSVCERVRTRCEPVLQHFGFPWPPALRCDRFHARNNVDDHMCMEGMEGPEGNVPDELFDADAPWSSLNTKPKVKGQKILTTPACNVGNTGGSGCNGAESCVEANSTAATILSSYELIRVWTAVWSISATLSTLFVVATFAVDSTRYSYLDRVVLLVASCSALCAIAHLSRMSFGQVASNATSATLNRKLQPCLTAGLSMTSSNSWSRGDPDGDCTVAFVVVYYFSSASSLWWLVLTIVFMLQTAGGGVGGRTQWTDAEIRRRLSTWFHLVAWAAPALATIVLLVRKEIAVDMTSSAVGSRSVCRVVAGSSSGLGLEVVPLSICLLTGLVVLFVSVVRLRVRRRSGDHVLNCTRKDNHKKSKEAGLLRTEVNQRKMTSDTQHSVGVTTSSCDYGSGNIVVRFGVVVVVGAIALTGTVSSVVYENVHYRPTSVVTLLVRITSSVLVAFVIGPWLIASGDAAISWNTFVVRRWQRKNPHHREHQHQLQQQIALSCGRPHCKDCLTVDTTSSRCRQQYSATHRQQLSDSVNGSQKWHQLPVDVETVAPVHGKRWRQPGGGYVGNTPKNMDMVPGGVAFPSKNLQHVCDLAGRDASLATVHRYHQSKGDPHHVIGLPPPPPPSQNTSTAAVNAQTWSSTSGFEHVSCKYCFHHQHEAHKYVI